MTQRIVSTAPVSSPFPKEIYYDQFRKEILTDPHAWDVEQGIALRRLQTGLPLSIPALKPGVHYMVEQLEQSKVYVLTKDALTCVVGAAERLRTKSGFVDPAPPVVPMWVEFEEGRLGKDDLASRALWIIPATLPGAQAREYGQGYILVRCGAVQPSDGQAFLLERDVSYAFYPSMREWRTRQAGGCRRSASCPLKAQNFHRNELRISSRQDGLAAVDAGCQCYEDGVGWTHILYVLFSLLIAEGAEHKIVNRQTRIPAGEKRTAMVKRLEQKNAEWNANHPSYVRISLSERIHVRRERVAGNTVLRFEERSDTGHIATLAKFPRLLIPGPDKPWRGSAPQIVWVESHDRFVHGERRTRYYVLP